MLGQWLRKFMRMINDAKYWRSKISLDCPFKEPRSWVLREWFELTWWGRCVGPPPCWSCWVWRRPGGGWGPAVWPPACGWPPCSIRENNLVTKGCIFRIKIPVQCERKNWKKRKSQWIFVSGVKWKWCKVSLTITYHFQRMFYFIFVYTSSM